MGNCYVLTNESRCYAALEGQYGVASLPQASGRLPYLGLKVVQEWDRPERRDKTGTRTFLGYPKGVRKETTFELACYLSGWLAGGGEPPYGAVLQAALGGSTLSYYGGVVAKVEGRLVTFASEHGLRVGQAVAIRNDVRFVVGIVDETRVLLNAPLTAELTSGEPADVAITFTLGRGLPSLTLYEYWPEEGLDRVVRGAVIDELTLTINADYHQFTVRGVAQDSTDRYNFDTGWGGLSAFPPEPLENNVTFALVGGNLGQAWLGATPEQFYTLTEAEVRLLNHVRPRSREFGWDVPRCIVPGHREVRVSFSLLVMPNQTTYRLGAMARLGEPVSVFLQLGDRPGQRCGVYLPAVVPELPRYDERGPELEWRFVNCRAQGWADDELFIALA